MATCLNLIKELVRSGGIRFAGRPSSMTDLEISFRNDPLVQRLLKGGRGAAPVICWELRRNGAAMPPLAQACLFWVLCQTAPDMAAHLVRLPLGGPADYSVALLTSLGPAWIPAESAPGLKATGMGLSDSDSARILAWIISTQNGRTGPPVGLDVWFDTYAIPGIANSHDRKLQFHWYVPTEQEGGTSQNWCTVEWPPPCLAPFGGWGRVAVNDSPARYALFLGENCKYFHLDGRTWEWLGPTPRYFCAGLVWLPRRLLTEYKVGLLLEDCTEIYDDDVRVGDIVEWGRAGGHWGVVWKVAPWGVKKLYRVEHYVPIPFPRIAEREYSSRVLEVRSKLGPPFQEAIHSPYDQALFYYFEFPPEDFELRFWRRNCFLKGNVIDLWIKTGADDNGEQCKCDAFWESPDIQFSKGPFPLDDRNWIPVGDTDPAIWIGQRYRIWAKVRNRGDRDLNGDRPPEGYPWDWRPRTVVPIHWFGSAYIRYYWAYSGCPQRDDWHLLSWPLGPFTVPARAGCDGNPAVNAPYAQWTPPAYDPATGLRFMGGHLCFLAIVYSICSCPGHEGNPPGDDPKNRCNADPIVYPWEPAWDNNIAMRNMPIIEARAGQSTTMSLLLGTPHDLETIQGALETVISHPFETARQGMTEDPAPLEVFLRMGGDSEITTSIDEYKEKGILFLPNDNKGLEKQIGGVVLPYKLPGGKRTQFFDVKIRAPKRAKPGSTYYVRIAQNLDGRIVSGCTIVVRIV